MEVQQTSLLLVDANTAAVGGVCYLCWCIVERSNGVVEINGAQLGQVLFNSVENVNQRNLHVMGVGKNAAGVSIKRC